MEFYPLKQEAIQRCIEINRSRDLLAEPWYVVDGPTNGDDTDDCENWAVMPKSELLMLFDGFEPEEALKLGECFE